MIDMDAVDNTVIKDIIDTHCYLGSAPILNIHIEPEFYRGLREDMLKKYNLDVKFLVMTPSIKDNFSLSRTIQKNQDIFLGGILQINPNKSLEDSLGYLAPDEIQRIIDMGNIVGLKLHTSFTKTRVNDPHIHDFADLAIAYNMPIIFHCCATGQDYTSADYFRELKDKKPELKIVCAHYGGLNEDYIPEYIKLVKEIPGLYLNTSGLSGEIKRWNLHVNPPTASYNNDPDRWVRVYLDSIEGIRDSVVFGSDATELSFTLHPVDKADASIQRKLFYDNPRKVFNLDI